PEKTSGAIQRRANLPARILEFKVEPASIRPGQTAMLIWSVENPNSVSVEPDLGKVTARGSKARKTEATTTYTLPLMGNNGTLTKSVTVTVAGTTASAGSTSAKKKEVALTADGKPDLSGVYNGGGGVTPAPQLKPGAEKFKVVRGPDDTGLYSDC